MFAKILQYPILDETLLEHSCVLSKSHYVKPSKRKETVFKLTSEPVYSVPEKLRRQEKSEPMPALRSSGSNF